MKKAVTTISLSALGILIALGIATSGYTDADRIRGSSIPLNSKGALYNNGGGVLTWDTTQNNSSLSIASANGVSGTVSSGVITLKVTPTYSITNSVTTPSVATNTALLDNTYNIIAPTATLSTYTVTMPASPVNGDAVYIKFTKLITTLTYSIGTGSVVASPTTITANQPAFILVYSSGTTSWY